MKSITPVSAWFMVNTMWVKLADGRVLVMPLSWYPRIKEASPAERDEFELTEHGIHWPGLNEYISVSGILAGRPSVVPANVKPKPSNETAPAEE